MISINTLIARHQATLFESRGDAEHCADCNNREPDGWYFKVRCVQHDPRRYVVVAHDEDGQFVGAL